jgi:hypothetical protein
LIFFHPQYLFFSIREILCSESFKTFADENLLVWSGQVWDAEAYALSMQLRCSSFPFLALLVCQSERSVQIADKIQGYMDERQLVSRLEAAMPYIDNIRREARQRSVFFILFLFLVFKQKFLV